MKPSSPIKKSINGRRSWRIKSIRNKDCCLDAQIHRKKFSFKIEHSTTVKKQNLRSSSKRLEVRTRAIPVWPLSFWWIKWDSMLNATSPCVQLNSNRKIILTWVSKNSNLPNLGIRMRHPNQLIPIFCIKAKCQNLLMISFCSLALIYIFLDSKKSS